MTFLALCFFLYCLPALLASGRSHPSATTIWFLNLLLGWTGIGWVLCLAWALSVPRPVLVYPAVHTAAPVFVRNYPAGWQAAGAHPRETICAACHRPIAPAASFCSMCGANGVPAA